MNLTRAILSTCAVASSIVCISAYSVASSEPSVKFTVAKPCSQESAPKPKMEILEPLGPLHDIAEPDILEAFKSRVGAMKASGEYDRRFNQNKDRIARELEHPTPVAKPRKYGFGNCLLPSRKPYPNLFFARLSPSRCRICLVHCSSLTGRMLSLSVPLKSSINLKRTCGWFW